MPRYEQLDNIRHRDLCVATVFGAHFGDNMAMVTGRLRGAPPLPCYRMRRGGLTFHVLPALQTDLALRRREMRRITFI